MIDCPYNISFLKAVKFCDVYLVGEDMDQDLLDGCVINETENVVTQQITFGGDMVSLYTLTILFSKEGSRLREKGVGKKRLNEI